jgi:TRAP-type C4-dicarboxylate transport system substrate-binding protein
MTSVPRDPGWKNLTETVQQAIESSAVRDEEHEKKLLEELKRIRRSLI